MSGCQEKTEVYSRIVGYFRPVQQWNIGKKSEYSQRRTFGVPADPDSIRTREQAYAGDLDKRVSGNVAN